MTNVQRVIAAFEGKEVDRVPAGFWFHFSKEQHFGQAAVNAHLELARKIELDMLKIMTESLMPYGNIQKASDWKSLKPFSRHSAFITQQIDMMKQVCAGLDGQLVLLATVHGVWASMFHIFNGPDDYEAKRSLLAAQLREDPDAFQHGLDVVTEGLAYLVEEMKGTGVHGFYYAALGAEKELLTTDEFAQYVQPRETALLRSAKDEKHYVVLHMCKDGLDLTRYRDYPCDVVNWGVYSNNPSLAEGKLLFPGKTILGGLDDRAGALVDGTPDEIKEEVFSLVKAMAGTPFILGADCTLPTDIPYGNIRIAIEATKELANQ